MEFRTENMYEILLRLSNGRRGIYLDFTMAENVMNGLKERGVEDLWELNYMRDFKLYDNLLDFWLDFTGTHTEPDQLRTVDDVKDDDSGWRELLEAHGVIYLDETFEEHAPFLIAVKYVGIVGMDSLEQPIDHTELGLFRNQPRETITASKLMQELNSSTLFKDNAIRISGAMASEIIEVLGEEEAAKVNWRTEAVVYRGNLTGDVDTINGYNGYYFKDDDVTVCLFRNDIEFAPIRNNYSNLYSYFDNRLERVTEELEDPVGAIETLIAYVEENVAPENMYRSYLDSHLGIVIGEGGLRELLMLEFVDTRQYSYAELMEKFNGIGLYGNKEYELEIPRSERLIAYIN